MTTELTSDTQSYGMFKGQHLFSNEIEQKGIAYACFNNDHDHSTTTLIN